jgi:phage gpG-like protein
MADTIKFENSTFKSIDAVVKKYAKREKRLENPKKAMEIVSLVLDRDVDSHFTESKGPSGKWKPLKIRTGKPLMDTGVLRLSMQRSAKKTSAKVFTRQKYAALHNFGGKTRVTKKSKGFFWGQYKKTGQDHWKNMALTKKTHFVIPKRKFMWASHKARQNIAKFFADFIIEGK